ncbi:MAG: hypothetical protein P8Y95_04220 [Gammaproteobacteria bacterium]
MSIMELGALGEFIGAIAVVVTLMFLALQVRHSARTMEESNRLERTAAIDRHNDSISRWRGRLMESESLARIWLAASNDEEMTDVDRLRLYNIFIDFTNTQRANFARARAVGEVGLALLSALSIANECFGSGTLMKRWDETRSWMELVADEFVSAVDEEIEKIQRGEPTALRIPWRTLQS